MKIDEFYVSPLGRAKDTAKATLERLNQKAEVKEWLQEFPCRIDRPDRSDKKMIAWDWLPQDWTTKENFYDKNNWSDSEILKAGNVDEEYRSVIQEFDIFLAEHGYEREGNYYKVTKPNNDTIAFFCHFGLGCVLLSHLLGISPMVLWHGFCAAPTSVTTVVTEERREGIASFRMSSYGIFLTYMQKMKNRLLRQGFVNAIKIVMKDMIKFGVIEIKENDCKTKCCVKQSYEKTKQ